jgi:CO/xanthine dehydrogenase Mo-binding subunit
VEVEAAQEVAKELKIHGLSFGESFGDIREAAACAEGWKARFEAADEAKAREVEAKAQELEAKASQVQDSESMVVDEDLVLQQAKKGKGREIPRKEQVKRSPTVEVLVPVGDSHLGYVVRLTRLLVLAFGCRQGE